MLLPAQRLGIVDRVPASQLSWNICIQARRLIIVSQASAGQWRLECVVTGRAVRNSR